MGPGIRVDTARTRDTEIVGTVDGAEAPDAEAAVA